MLNNVDVLVVKEKVGKLMFAAKAEDWDLVDSQIVPDLKSVTDGNLLAEELLDYSNNSDSNVRDAVATGLIVAGITDDDVLDRSIKTMITMSRDNEKFPAGRSVLFLGKYKDLERYFDRVNGAIEAFKGRVEDNGWREELIENIPEMESIL